MGGQWCAGRGSGAQHHASDVRAPAPHPLTPHPPPTPHHPPTPAHALLLLLLPSLLLPLLTCASAPPSRPRAPPAWRGTPTSQTSPCRQTGGPLQQRRWGGGGGGGGGGGDRQWAAGNGQAASARKCPPAGGGGSTSGGGGGGGGPGRRTCRPLLGQLALVQDVLLLLALLSLLCSSSGGQAGRRGSAARTSAVRGTHMRIVPLPACSSCLLPPPYIRQASEG